MFGKHLKYEKHCTNSKCYYLELAKHNFSEHDTIHTTKQGASWMTQTAFSLHSVLFVQSAALFNIILYFGQLTMIFLVNTNNLSLNLTALSQKNLPLYWVGVSP